MAKGRRGTNKGRKVNYELVPLTHGAYGILGEVMGEHHESLAGARIALAWRKEFKADVDGHVVLGKCMKVSDLHKEFSEFDFIILLNREAWEHFDFGVDKKRALIDHELCHAAPATKDGEQLVDER